MGDPHCSQIFWPQRASSIVEHASADRRKKQYMDNTPTNSSGDGSMTVRAARSRPPAAPTMG